MTEQLEIALCRLVLDYLDYLEKPTDNLKIDIDIIIDIADVCRALAEAENGPT